jgi:DinB superfamily
VDSTKERLDRMCQTPDEVAAAIGGQPDDVLGRRPAADAWSATEIVCHLRDIEEFYLERVRLILTHDEPPLIVLDPDRWADERQYRRHDIVRAHTAFSVRRRETLAVLDALGIEEWERGGLHRLRGRLTVRHIVHGWARHDLGHLDQLKRAVAGHP